MTNGGEPVLIGTFCGTPNTARGEGTRIHADPSGVTDRVAYASGRVAVVRSTTDPLDCSVFAMHTYPVTCARFSPDGTMVASGDEGGFVRVWIVETGAQKWEFQAAAGAIRDVAFSKDVKFLAIGSDQRGGYAKVIKLPGGGAAGSCAGHQKKVLSVDIRPEGEGRVATCGEDFSVGWFVGPPVKETQVPKTLKHHSNFANQVKFSPDGSKAASCSSDKTLVIIDAESAEVSQTITSHTGSVLGLDWNASSTEVVTASADKTLRVHDAASGAEKFCFNAGSTIDDMQNGCAWVPKTNDLIGVSLRGDLSVVEVGSSTKKASFQGHSRSIVGAAVVGTKIYSADYVGKVVPWVSGTGLADRFFTGNAPANICAVDANEKVVGTVGQDGRLFVTKTETLEFGDAIEVRGGGVDVSVPRSGEGNVAAVMINESRVVAVGYDNAVIAQKDFERSEKGCAIAVNSDGSLVAVSLEVSGGSGEIRFFTLEGSSLVKTGDVLRMPSAANRMAISPSGSVLAVGEKSRRVKLYETLTGNKVDGGGVVHNARVDAVAFSPDGQHVATGSLDGSLAVWPVGSALDPQKVAPAHRGGVTGVGFTADNVLVSAGNDNAIRTWKLAA